VRSIDVPQMDRLSDVRAVVAAVALGGPLQVDGLSDRQAQYGLHAARALQLVAEGPLGAPEVTERGRALLAAAAESDAARAVLREAIAASPAVRAVAAGLMSHDPPDRARITAAISARTRLAPATAARRAATLLGWRAQVSQPELFPADGQPLLVAEAAPAVGEAVNLQLVRVQVEDYGLLHSVDVRLGTFQVMIGANGSGKSTLLDALLFVSDALNDGVERAWRRRAERFEELVWGHGPGCCSIAVEIALPASVGGAWKLARYELSIGPLEVGGVGVRHESLDLLAEAAVGVIHAKVPKGGRRVVSLGEGRAAHYQSERDKWKTVFRLGDDRLALAFVQQVPERFGAALAVRDLLRGGLVMLALSGDRLRSACAPDLGTTLRRDGENLPLALRALRSSNPRLFKAWLAQVREALPDVKDVTVVERPEDKRSYVVITWQSGLRVPAWRLSDGTLRILALTLLGYLEADAVYLIEEPENGVHPQAVEAVYEALSTSRTAQFLVATHSPVFLGIARPDQLLCVRSDGHQSFVVSGTDHPNLSGWDRRVDLSTLFAAGVLG
jgi:predicted ATPase